jgi:enoyl-CoA hydratase
MVEDVAWITMDDGKVNVLSTDMLEELESCLQASREARITVLQGRPGIFAAGFDLKTFQQGEAASRAMVEAGVSVITAILDHPHPLITVCTGHAYPMGAFLMLAADVRLGSAGDWRIGLNEVAIAITVPEFALALARHRLTPAGFNLVATGAMVGPEQAAALGYLDVVVPAQELEALTRDTIAQLRQVDLAAYAATKARVRGPLRDEVLAASLR